MSSKPTPIALFKKPFSISSLLVITTVQQLEAKSTGCSYATKFNVCTKMMMKVVLYSPA